MKHSFLFSPPGRVPFGQRGLALSALDVSVNWAWILGLLVARRISEQTSLPSSWAPGKEEQRLRNVAFSFPRDHV